MGEIANTNGHDAGEGSLPRLVGPPSIIYLQWHGSETHPEPDDDEIHPEDVTWCADKVFKHDVEYIRKDHVPQIAPLVEAVACLAHCLQRGPLWGASGHLERSLKRAWKLIEETRSNLPNAVITHAADDSENQTGRGSALGG